jgi:hypothetical protein
MVFIELLFDFTYLIVAIKRRNTQHKMCHMATEIEFYWGYIPLFHFEGKDTLDSLWIDLTTSMTWP